MATRRKSRKSDLLAAVAILQSGKEFCPCCRQEISLAKKTVPLAPADVTPGEILLEEFMKPLGIGINALARKMVVDPMRVSQIVRGKRAITADTAFLLAETFGTSARLWLGLQTNYDLAMVAKSRGPVKTHSRRQRRAQAS